MATPKQEGYTPKTQEDYKWVLEDIKASESWINQTYGFLASQIRRDLKSRAEALGEIGLFDENSNGLDRSTSLLPIHSLCQDKNERQVHMDKDGTLYVCDQKKYVRVGLTQPYPGTIQVWDWETKRPATDVEVVQMFPQVLEGIKGHINFKYPQI